MIGTAPGELRALVDRLERLAERRLALGPRSEPAATRARQLVDHVRSHVRVRATSLEAPLVVLLVGPTGAGKSTIFNTIAGRAASPTGVLRPTTRTAVVLAHPIDRAGLREGALEGFSAGAVRFVTDNDIAPGLALIDTPDVDSVEHANRLLADRLVEAADLAVFVTTATRYADRVPWSVLERVRERGLPLLVVVNRMPDEAQDRAEILSDVERLMAEAGLETELIGVREGDLEPDGARLLPQTIRRLTDEIARLRADRDARIELAARALMGSLAGLGESVERVADDVDHEAIDVDALAARRGSRLRERAGRPAAGGPPRLVPPRGGAAPLADLRRRGPDDALLLRGHRAHPRCDPGRPATGQRTGPAKCARRPRTTFWPPPGCRPRRPRAGRRAPGRTGPGMGETVSADADLWLPSHDFDERLRGRLDGWIDSIVADIQLRGGPKRSLARGGTLGVNVLGTGVMLASFLHTGGLTGAEIGVAAATAFLNQKLLAALFGEAAMAELVGDARQRLQELLQTTFDEERVRFDALLPPEDVLPAPGPRPAHGGRRSAGAAGTGVTVPR